MSSGGMCVMVPMSCQMYFKLGALPKVLADPAPFVKFPSAYFCTALFLKANHSSIDFGLLGNVA